MDLQSSFMVEKLNLLALDIGTVEPPNPVYDNEGTIFGVGRLFQNGFTAFYSVAGLLLFGYLLYGGVQWLVASGNSDNKEAAQQTITNAVIGMVILVASLFIVDIGTGVLGLDSPFKITIPTLLP